MPAVDLSPAVATEPAAMASTYLFTATVSLGHHYGPIPMVGGGVRVVEPFTAGSIDGPDFHATIHGGHASPIIVNDTKISASLDGEAGVSVQYPYIYVYGTTEDGVPFYIEETGVGNRASQNTRLIINVGGKYSYLQTKYIVATMKFIEGGTKVAVDCFDIPFIAKAP